LCFALLGDWVFGLGVCLGVCFCYVSGDGLFYFLMVLFDCFSGTLGVEEGNRAKLCFS
jgi:hypothetical protein